jgi:DNA-binding CsgD family transcriptional regulator
MTGRLVGRCDDSSMPREALGSTLDSARSALASGDFSAATELYEASLQEERTADALDGLGQALWFLGRIEDGIARREEAYTELKRRGDACRAGEIALWLTIEQATSIGNQSAANGWFRRAERVLAGAELCPAHAQLEVAKGQAAGTAAEAEQHYQRAIEIGEKLGDPDSEVRGLASLGYLKVTLGHLEAGTALLDEAMAAAMGGEVHSPWAIGATCCSMLFACDRVSDLRRATEWCRTVLGFTQRRSYVPLSALCRSVYAGVLTSSGDWERAEQELEEALRAYGGADRPLAAYPLARLAELRLRQGRLEEARRLIEGWEDHPELRGTALRVLIAQGEGALARAKLEEELAAVGEESPYAASLLPLAVEVRLSDDDVEGARAAAEGLGELANRLGHGHLAAAAELALGRVEASGGGEFAARYLGAARDRFAELGMPFEEARCRLELARAVASGQPELAVAEARAALLTSERLGAASCADAAAELLRSLGVPGRPAPKRPGELTKREREVLALLEEGLTNKEIASRLFITPKTASHHVSRILFKLDVRTRAEAAAHAARERAGRSAAK